MAPEVLFRVCCGTSKVTKEEAARLTIKPAILHDYCRHRVKLCDYPGIIPQVNHTVRGTYVTGLTAPDIRRLDAFEGSQYLRKKVEVALLQKAGDKEVECDTKETETYVFVAGDDYLEKTEWDFDEFRREKMHRWADHSDEYVGMFCDLLSVFPVRLLTFSQRLMKLLQRSMIPLVDGD